jgi:hypothetical protein
MVVLMMCNAHIHTIESVPILDYTVVNEITRKSVGYREDNFNTSLNWDRGPKLAAVATTQDEPSGPHLLPLNNLRERDC